MAGQVCQHCGENPATIHFTEIKDDDRIELHVCEECAAAQGITTESSVPSVLTQMVVAASRGASQPNLSCPHCGMTWKDFRKKGRLGCPHDYEVFETVLGPIIANMHGGADHHTGRLPIRTSAASLARSQRLVQLRKRQQEAVDGERYEQAARLRDEILLLEGDPSGAESTPSGG